MRKIVPLLAALLLAACAQLPTTQEEIEEVPLKAVAHVDLPRYMGRWYLIANIPYFAERGNVAPHVDYSLRPDGLIRDVYTAQDAFDKKPFTKNGVIEVLNKNSNAEGSISFLPSLWQDYAVLLLDDDYQVTVIGHPSRNFCWIFSRQPTLDDGSYQRALAVLKKNLFDVSRVLKIPQTPDQVGQPGFQ